MSADFLPIEDEYRTIYIAPSPELRAALDEGPAMQAADVLLVGGTCWTNDKVMRREVGARERLAMGHLPRSGPGGMTEYLRPFSL